jgi:hypothetical protein
MKQEKMRHIPKIFFLIALFAITSGFVQVDVWTKLGSRRVSHSADHDEILVTGRAGTFNAIKLTVEKADVTIGRVIVMFRGGGTEEMQLRNRISAGGETRAIDIRGRNRIIRKVIFYYTTQPGESKKAKVTLYGRH